MKKLTTLIIILFSLPVLIAGLQSCGDDCPDFQNPGETKYKLTGSYNSFFYEIDSIGKQIKAYEEFDTISINKPIRLNLFFKTEKVALAVPENSKTSILMACSPVDPPPPLPTQNLVKLSIVTKNNFGTNFVMNDTINSYFKFPRVLKNYPYAEELLDLSFLTNKLAEQELKLVFTPPKPLTEVTPFQIEAILTLSDSSVITITSPKVYLGI